MLMAERLSENATVGWRLPGRLGRKTVWQAAPQ